MATSKFIYFIVDSQNQKVKIGTSKRPEKRLKQLLTAYPGKLEITKIIKGSVADEKAYHSLFCHSKICREWFDLSPEIQAFLNR